MNKITNIKWETDDERKCRYSFEFNGQKIFRLIPDNNETPLLDNDELSKKWIYQNYGDYLSMLGF